MVKLLVNFWVSGLERNPRVYRDDNGQRVLLLIPIIPILRLDFEKQEG